MKKTNCPNLAKNLIILLILSLVFVVLFSGSIYALSSDNINLQGKIVRNDTGHEGMNVIPGSPACCC
jgi:Na+-transporting NADH:ubiquinone oxidoreductase subunit NqrC